ncbi:MAG: chemotaxis protein CheA [Ignavibacteria bacterium]|jgi:two-component system chemotaxis sensor kinase CheA|nr:chemotaxis protein CheA [Ignavibacteria bacterium]
MAVFDDPEMQEIFEGFLVEANEILESITTDIVEIEKTPDDLELINKLFRSFHTIKGTASFMGFADISGITHHAEDILNKLRKEELTVNRDIIDVLLEVQDWIVSLIEKVQNEDNSPVDYNATIAKIEILKTGKTLAEAEGSATTEGAAPADAPATEGASPIENTAAEEAGGRAVDAVFSNPDLVTGSDAWSDDELKLIDSAFLEVNSDFWNEQDGTPNPNAPDADAPPENEEKPAEPPTEEVKPEETPAPEQAKTPTPTDPVVAATNAPSGPPKAAPAAKPVGKPPAADTTIRVDVNRVEAILDLSGELVLNRNRLTQISEYLASDITFETFKDGVKDLVETAESIDSITSEIQGAAMKMRMVPVGKLYQKAPRIVRDLSREFNKKINLVVKGEETEIDRGIIEELTDPLTHMIRNSCDHGIEMPEIRAAKGKSETGTITLDAEQEGNNIVLKIIDDGAGMDPEVLKANAIKKGVVTPEQAAAMTPKEALQLIFAPGFSTAAKVTSVSGRGVGMDVVKTNIAELKGFVEIETEFGKGTTFLIKLPLTLAIIQGLIVNCGGEKFAIPLNSVLNVVSVEVDNIYTLNQVEVVRIREDVIPLLRLDYALDTPEKKDNITGSYIVIIGVGTQSIGIIVNDLLGQQEVVIKSLGEYLGTIKAISGSTIMGDGSVIMIVDVAVLVQSVYDQRQTHEAMHEAHASVK